MKFNVAWSEVLTQNVALRVVILCLSTCVVGLLAVTAKLALREPVVIERACFSQAVGGASTERTAAEVLSFVKEALSQRFDTEAVPQDGFLSPEETAFREQEQKALKEKQMRQRVLVNRVEKISGPDLTVDTDRVLSVGPVRSALAFPLLLTVNSIPRSRGNPYGLRLAQVRAAEKPREDEKKNEK